MSLSDYDIKELIAELHARSIEKTFVERIEFLISDSFSNIDRIIDNACDELDKLKPKTITFDFSDKARQSVDLQSISFYRYMKQIQGDRIFGQADPRMTGATFST